MPDSHAKGLQTLDEADRIDGDLIPATARACHGCRRVRPVNRFPYPDQPRPLCLDCSALFRTFRIRPDPTWPKFPCSGCDSIVTVPPRSKEHKAMLCRPCHDGWEAFDREMRKRGMR